MQESKPRMLSPEVRLAWSALRLVAAASLQWQYVLVAGQVFASYHLLSNHILGDD